MGRTYSAEAIVIKRRNFGEADRIVTLLSRYRGKFSGLAKGIRKIASRRGPNLELLNHVKAHFAVGKSLDVVTEVDTLHTFKHIKDDLGKVGSGFHIVEITDEFLADGQGGRETFDLLLTALTLLDQRNKTQSKKILRAFELKILSIVGFKLELRECGKCGQTLREDTNNFAPEIGGVVDKKCAANVLYTKPISPDAQKLLRFLQEESWPMIGKIAVTPLLLKEAEQLLRFYIEYLLEKDLKSAEFIEKIAN